MKGNRMIEIKTLTEEQTKSIGEKLGSLLSKGDVLCLDGELGTGKSVFVTGIARSLGVDGYITSPTFTLVNEYTNVPIPLFHFDVYRIGHPDEMFEIGFEEYIYGEGIVVIEWASIITEILPKERIEINIYKNLESSIYERIIKINFVGERYYQTEKSLIERL